MNDMPERLTYTLAEVSAMTHLALTTLIRDCRAGRIEHTRKGRSRVMTLEQIEVLLAQHRQSVVEPVADTAEDQDRRRALARLARTR